MSDQDTVERLQAQGVEAKTVGEIMGDAGHGAPAPTPTRFMPVRLEGCPELPSPGIYFGMSDEEYHALPALSNSGIKKLAASPMIFWASTAWLSETKRKQAEEAKQTDEKAHHIFGKAYHCRLMEGASAYALRYAIKLDPADFPDVLVSTDQIKAAIGTHTQRQPVKPSGRSKDELETQVRALCAQHSRNPLEAIPEGTKITLDVLKGAIATFEEDAPVVPVRKVEDKLADGTEYMRDAVKADWIAQLLALDPEAQIFANIEAEYEREHAGKTFLFPDQHAELEIAALMVDRDPEMKDAFKGGHAEVTLIWYCPATGVPMKARVDYLKIKMMVDLKSIANQRERSIEQAIRFEIAQWKYNLQPVVYFEGADIVRQLVREQGESCVHSCDHAPEEGPTWKLAHANRVGWAMKWASHRVPDEWLWVFQQKGAAPITRGVWFPRGGTTDMVTKDIVNQAKRKFRQFSEAFGTSPWLDVKPSYMIADEEIPQSATEI